LGGGSFSKDRRPLLKGECHSHVYDRLRQDSPKDACSISYVSAPVSPDGNRNICTHADTLNHPSEDATHPAGRRSLKGFHSSVLQFCKYTCTGLQHVPISCHFATFYSFPGKNISSPLSFWCNLLQALYEDSRYQVHVQLEDAVDVPQFCYNKEIVPLCVTLWILNDLLYTYGPVLSPS
jgi:hypothetical protein